MRLQISRAQASTLRRKSWCLWYLVEKFRVVQFKSWKGLYQSKDISRLFVLLIRKLELAKIKECNGKSVVDWHQDPGL